ncbi:AAA family ATPase [Massilia horti]|uniref:ATP-binding protein n=1 Tax=Massilia horti TaxID=2562153 RepID=A0A4Y9SY48_9BURK|nr:AAA family ATPase [Massilia horti]TFW31779.1 ATP-binding protein [Massilia horti]
MPNDNAFALSDSPSMCEAAPPKHSAEGSGMKVAIKHPLLSGKVVLPTPPISELYRTIKRIVLLREPGCCFTAKSGVGKSYALTMVESQLRKEFPEMCVFRHVILNHQVPSIRAFFKHFLRTARHSERKGETSDLRERLINRLIDGGTESGLDLVVLLIDEAQEMALQDFKFLKDVGNELDKEGVQLVVIMMGQDPEFDGVIQKLRDGGHLDLVSRFTMRKRSFRGLSTVEDFTAVLAGIDSAVFPDRNGSAWPQFFIPRAWTAGFRMQAQAKALLDALISAAGSNSTKAGFPARQLFLAIRALLLDHAAKDSATLEIGPKAWADAVEYALIEDALAIAAAAEMKQQGKKVKVKR